jgi:Terpene cyclase DEP1
MKPKTIYLCLCVLGTIVPYWQLLPFLREHGPDVRLMIAQLFSAPVSAFFGADVIVSSLVLWAFVAIDGRRTGVRHLWAPVLANLAVGVSLGLPLFLYLRERAGIK